MIKPAKDNSEFVIDFDADDDFVKTSPWEAEGKSPVDDLFAKAEVAGAPETFPSMSWKTDSQSLAADLFPLPADKFVEAEVAPVEPEPAFEVEPEPVAEIEPATAFDIEAKPATTAAADAAAALDSFLAEPIPAHLSDPYLSAADTAAALDSLLALVDKAQAPPPAPVADEPAPDMAADPYLSAAAQEPVVIDPFLSAPLTQEALDPFLAAEVDDPMPSIHDDYEASDPFLSMPLAAPIPPSMAAAAAAMESEINPPDPFADLQLARGAEPVRERQVMEEPVFPASVGEPMGAGLAGAGLDNLTGVASAPRIAIHIFCDRPETAQAAEAAAGDRRMSRATTAVQPGGLAGAVVHYQNQPTPSLIIVESGDPAPVLVGLLDQLAEVCDPGTKVIVIGRSNDIALYRELMKRGVSEYLVPPIQPLQIIQSITNLYADPSAPFIGRSIAFVGAKGGVGSSTIAHNFAHALTEYMQSHAVVVDFDLPFGTAGLDFNQDPLQGVADALSQPDRLDPVLLDRMMVRCTERLSLFAAPATLDDDYDISAEAFEEVASKIRTTAPFVVLDLPHLWSGWMRRTLLGCEEVVIVAAPDLASLRNAKNMIDLIRHARPNDQPPRLVLNQVGVTGRPEIPTKDFAAALGVEPSVIISFDPKLFGQAANNGQMISETGPKSKASESINQLAQIISRREPPPQPKKSLLAGLLKK